MGSNAFEWPEERSPLQELQAPLFQSHEVSVSIKRDDLLVPFGGNKGRKLKYNWKTFLDSGMTGLITLGGPFSNHLYAFATLCSHFDVPGKALVRGEVTDKANPVLRHIRDSGVEVIGMTRADYAQRYSEEFARTVAIRFPGYMFIPEGGAGRDGIRGCYELGEEIMQQSLERPDVILVGAGTGTTAAGISVVLGAGSRVVAVSALREKIIRPAFGITCETAGVPEVSNLTLNSNYHFGGFAKWNDELIEFVREFESDHNILLDPLYTAKTAYAVFDMIDKGHFQRGSHIVMVHTGGMAGRLGFNYRFPGLLGPPS